MCYYITVRASIKSFRSAVSSSPVSPAYNVNIVSFAQPGTKKRP